MSSKKEFLETDIISRGDLEEELNKFYSFAFKKSMIELAVAVILGGAFNKVVTAVSNNILMPIINAVLATTGTKWRETIWTPLENVNIEIGKFLGSTVDFVLTALVLYIIYIKIIKNVWRVATTATQKEKTEKEHLLKPVPIKPPYS